MPDLSDQIEADAAKLSAASNEMGSFTKRPLTELIEADKHLKGETALTGTNQNGGPKSGWACARIARAVPPGSV